MSLSELSKEYPIEAIAAATSKIWQTFRNKVTKNDVDAIRGRGGDLTYCSWSNAYAIAAYHFPTFVEWTRAENTVDGVPVTEECLRRPDGTATVTATVTIIADGVPVSRSWTHPVMVNNRTIARDPSIDVINKAKLRAMVKCLAFFGLGIELWTGEDLPTGDDATVERAPAPRHTAPAKVPATPSAYDDTIALYLATCKAAGIDAPANGPATFPANVGGLDLTGDAERLNRQIQKTGNPKTANARQLERLFSALEDYKTAIEHPNATEIKLPHDPAFDLSADEPIPF